MGGERFREVPADRVLIQDLRLSCIVGVRERERAAPQEVVLDLVLYADLRAAGASDRLEDTVDYSALTRRVEQLVERSSFGLLEALAGSVARLCLEDPKVQAVTVRVEKPAALPRGRAAVEIYREREDLRPPMGFAPG
jgi:FolB domain-containing protein